MPYPLWIPPRRETLMQSWLCGSSEDAWKNFQLRSYNVPPVRLPDNWLTQHTLVFNVGGEMSTTQRVHGKAKKSHFAQGEVIELSSPGLSGEVQFNDECRFLSLSFEPVFVDRFMEMDNFTLANQYKPEDETLSSILSAINHVFVHGQVSEKLYTESLITACLVHLVSNYASTGKKVFAPKGKLSSKQLKNITEYVHEYVQTNLNLPQLAACVHLSPFHFARLFRQTVGISPYRYVLQMKIEHAKKLIRERGVSMSDVAYALSFTDQAHFSNAFKKVTGVCPRQFLQTTAA